MWSPVDDLRVTEMVFPLPGTTEPFAVIRWVDVQREGVPVSLWRAVTYQEPRRLIGYFDELKDAAMACHREGVSAMVPAALNETIR